MWKLARNQKNAVRTIRLLQNILANFENFLILTGYFQLIIPQSLHKKQLKYQRNIYQIGNAIFHVHEKIWLRDSVQERDRLDQNGIDPRNQNGVKPVVTRSLVYCTVTDRFFIDWT